MDEDRYIEDSRLAGDDAHAPDEYGSSGTGRKRGIPPVLRSIIDIIVVLIVAVLLTILIRTFLVESYRIPSQSMMDTIQVNDRVFAEKISYRTGDIERGDIVTFMNPNGSGETLIKRVIAVGGDTVDLVDGVVYLNGEPLDEPYTEGKRSDPSNAQLSGVTITYPYTVPEGYIWVMGDNRTNSKDSRYFGAVPESSVTGHAFFTYWPISSMGKLE